MSEGARRVILVTPRLRVTEWRPEDLPGFLALHADPVTMRYFISGPYDRARAEARLADLLQEQRDSGWTKWRVEDRDSERTLGRAGFGVADDGVSRELGYLLARDAWGRGLASEVAAALVARHRAERADDLLAFAHVENAASRRVLEKVGFTAEREGDWRGKPHVFYVLRGR